MHPNIVQTASEKRFVETVDERTLEFSLQLENRATARLLMLPETLERLRHAACQLWRYSSESLYFNLKEKNLNYWIWGLNPQFNVSENKKMMIYCL